MDPSDAIRWLGSFGEGSQFMHGIFMLGGLVGFASTAILVIRKLITKAPAERCKIDVPATVKFSLEPIPPAPRAAVVSKPLVDTTGLLTAIGHLVEQPRVDTSIPPQGQRVATPRSAIDRARDALGCHGRTAGDSPG